MNQTTLSTPMSFKDYYFGTFIRPRRTFDLLLKDERRLKFGFFAIVLNAFLYTFIYIFLTIAKGAPSSFEPWLAVPQEVYSSYNRFGLAPSMLGCWIRAAGVAHLFSRLLAGKGSFEDTLSVFGFGITIATFFALLHDLPDTFLGAIGVLDLRWYELQLNSPTIWRIILWICYGTGLTMLVVLLIKGVGASQKIKPVHALWIGTIAAVVYQGFFLVFNR